VGECAELLALWREAGALPSVTERLDVLEALVAGRSGCVLVAARGSRLVGSVIVGFDGWRGSVYRLAVLPGERRRGVGRRLLEAAECRLVELGARRLHVTVAQAEHPAVAFWEAAPGWERDPRAIRLTKTLA